MKKIRLKAKDKGRYLFKKIEINEFFNDLCRKLKSCGQMLSPSQSNTSPNTQQKQ